jgi:hypothetical protein
MTEDGQSQAENQDAGREKVGKDADVGIGEVRRHVHHEQQHERKQAAGHDDQAGQADPVAQQRWVRRFLLDSRCSFQNV